MPLLAIPVLLDSLSFQDIEELIMISSGPEHIPCSELIGVCGHDEVAELAWFILLHTGGVPRVVARTLSELIARG